MHIQRKNSDLDCLWESASPSLFNLGYEKGKNINAVGNQNSSETHVITMSSDQKDYGAFFARWNACAILPT